MLEEKGVRFIYMTNFQRKHSSSNTQVGSDFESIALMHISKEIPTLKKNFPLKIGIYDQKTHKFDLLRNSGDTILNY